jgi:hypothetical protein
MTKTLTINSPVDVTAMGFGRGLIAYPKRIEYGGSSIDFVDAGIRTIVQRGERIAQIFTMSDGAKSFCLRSIDKGGSWTLLSIIS